MGAPPPGLDRGGAVPRGARRASLIAALALLGLLAGALWGAADEPRFEARASVVPVGGSISPARLERYAELGAGRAVARRAAALLGDDVPGADLLASVAIAPLPNGGGLGVTADAAAPDVAAAAADAYARALAGGAVGDLEPGAAAALPGAPAENRPTLPWALAGLLAGLLAGVAIAKLAARRDPVAGASAAPAMSPSASGPAAPGPASAGPPPEPAPRPAGEESPTAEFEAVLGAPLLAVLGDADSILEPGPGGPGVAAQDRDEVRHLAAALGLGESGGPRVVAMIPAHRELDPTGAATALALAGSELRLRTLLVEAHLGDPALAVRLGLDPVPGLLEHLRGEAGPREVLRGIAGTLDPDRPVRVACVPAGAGAGAGETARLVSGERLAALLGRLRRAYELVVVAGPPLGEGTGAESLAARVEAVLAVSGERGLPGGDPGGAAAHLSSVPLRGGILMLASDPG